MWVEWEDGAELSQSRKKPGDYSPLTRDGDNNLGHATLREVDEDEAAMQTVFAFVSDEREGTDELSDEQALAALAVLGVIVAARIAAPRVKQWWNERSLPFLKATRMKFLRTRAPGGELLETESSIVTGTGSAQTSSDVFPALQEYRARMSSAEARDRLIAALVARLFSEEQLNALHNAQIEDDYGTLELASAMENLTPQKLTESITAMLEANPSWPNDETLAELGKVLGHSKGHGVPVVGEETQQPLRLTDGMEKRALMQPREVVEHRSGPVLSDPGAS
jgi:hypothetical protein